MLCANCKNRVEKGAKTCPACGKKIYPGCWFCAGGSLLCRNCYGGYGEYAMVEGFMGKTPIWYARKHHKNAPRVTCPDCQGTGIDPMPCPVCMGTNVPKSVIMPCPVCQGSGIEKCRECDSQGNCRGECLEGHERCLECNEAGCPECGSTGKEKCLQCSGIGCEKCKSSGIGICHYCGGLGRCPECIDGKKPCPWCSAPEHKADLLEIWDKGFHDAERNGNVDEIMFFHKLVLPHLPPEQRDLILKYSEKRLVPCGFPVNLMEELKAEFLSPQEDR